MALQEVCGFQDTPVYPRWNTPASLSMARRHNILHSGVWDGSEPSLAGGRDAGVPLIFYVPDLEHFPENPLEVIAPPFQLCHGTTTVAFAFQGGVVAAADSRASCRGLVSSPDTQKILPVHPRLVMTMSGSGSDCIAWRSILSRELRLYRLRHRRQLSPGGAAKLLALMLHPFKGTEVCVAAMLCGWEGEEDREEGGRSQGGGAGARVEESGRKRKMADWDGGKQEGRETEPIGGRGKEPIRGRGTEGEPIGEQGGEGQPNRVRGKEAGPIKGRGRERGPIQARGRETEPIRERGREGQPMKEPIGGGREGKAGETDPGLTEPVGTGSLSVTLEQKTEGTFGTAGTGRGSGVRGPGPSGPRGPRLFYVCSDGTRLQGELFSVGSGSPYAYSVLDGEVRWGMGVAEAFQLAREAVYQATHRDAYSGNCVDLYHITASGWRRRQREDLKEEYYRERQREREKVEERRRGGVKERNRNGTGEEGERT